METERLYQQDRTVFASEGRGKEDKDYSEEDDVSISALVKIPL